MYDSAEQRFEEARRAFEVGDERRARETLEVLLTENFSPAIYALASWYQHGRVVEEDKQKSFSLFRLASDLGNTDSFYELAVCYELGDGCEIDLSEAAHWYHKAAKTDDPVSVAEFARVTYYGIGCPKNKREALELYRRAASLGDAESKSFLEQLEGQNGSDQRERR